MFKFIFREGEDVPELAEASSHESARPYTAAEIGFTFNIKRKSILLPSWLRNFLFHYFLNFFLFFFLYFCDFYFLFSISFNIKGEPSLRGSVRKILFKIIHLYVLKR